MDDLFFIRMMDTILSLEPVAITHRKGFRTIYVGWSDNLRAVWTVPVDQALDTDYDHLGIDQRKHVVRRADEMREILFWFATDMPKVDGAVFTLEGAPAEVAVATVKAFRDWRSSPSGMRLHCPPA